jgi:coenzyme F420 hydrogenase subunit beta
LIHKSQRVGFEESLQEKVISKKQCIGCGVCVLVCPSNCIEHPENPRLAKKCSDCGLCARICPRYEFSDPNIEKMLFKDGHMLSEDFGRFRRIAIAKVNDESLLQRAQDGGVVSALLNYALTSKIIDGAIVSSTSAEKPLYPVPKLVSTPEEVAECAGARYCYSPNIMALKEAFEQKKKSIAFVGTGCQIHAMRKLEAVPIAKYSTFLKFSIGLLCADAFTYEGLMERYIQGTLGINLNEISKINIKGKIIVTKKSGETVTIPLNIAKQFVHDACISCTDFSSQFADISAGGLGLKNWTFVIIRTRIGEEIFEGAEKAGILKVGNLESQKDAFDILTRLSRRKKKLPI